MSGHDRVRLLVAYPPELARYELFKSKIERIVGHIEALDVVSLGDSRGFAQRYFGQKVGRSERTDIPLKKKRTLVEDCTHAVIFWDGTSHSDLVYLSMLLRRTYRVVPIETTRVVNRDKGDEFDIYIGRRTPWGNPYAIGQDGTREEVIDKFREYFGRHVLSDPGKQQMLTSLRGKRLGCHCKPMPCHGDIIAEYLNGLDHGFSSSPGPDEEARDVSFDRE